MTDDDECPNPKCDGGWIEDRHDPEQVEKCPKCGGTGRVRSQHKHYYEYLEVDWGVHAWACPCGAIEGLGP